MKGVEKSVLYLIILVVGLVVVMGVFIIPMIGTQKKGDEAINFYLLCNPWRQKQYQITTFQMYDAKGGLITVDSNKLNEVCTKELGRSCIGYPNCMVTEDDWNDCIAACKSANNTKRA